MKNKYLRLFLYLLIVCFYSHSAFACGNGDFTLPESHLYFIENKGQLPSQVNYAVEMNMARLFLENDRLTYWLMNPQDIENIHASHHSGQPVNELSLRCHAFGVHFVGANPQPQMTPSCIADHYNNYYIGNDPSKWASHVGLYRQADYNNLYDGVGMRIYGEGAGIKYDMIVQPNADIAQIQLQYEGIDNISLVDGELHIGTSVNNLIEQRPFAYQFIDGQMVQIPCEFALQGNTVSFVFPQGYHTDAEIIIDPFIVFSTYTGSTTNNLGFTATYDNDGHLFAGGTVFFGNGYPITTGAFQIDFAGGSNSSAPFDMGITKFTPDGSGLVYSTYLGGQSGDETPQSLIVDANNNLIVFGSTTSDNYPTTAGAFDNTHNGGNSALGAFDIIVTKFNSDGTALIGSTYLGGSGTDGFITTNTPLVHNFTDGRRGEVVIDNQGFIYVASTTSSINFPTTEAFQPTSGGLIDAVVVKFSPDLTELVWATYLGGSSNDAAYSVKVDTDGSVYVVGGTSSNNFPTTVGTLHPTYNGGTTDGFIAKLSNDGTTLLAGTYIGTSSYDQIYFLELDPANDFVYVLGQTEGDYPIVGNVYNNPNSGVFIHKISDDLTTTGYSTVIGNGNGFPNISPTAFLVDVCDQIYISGWGGSLSGAAGSGTLGMPVTANAFQSSTDGSDFYFAILSGDGSELNYATFFGAPSGTGEHVDGGTSRFDKKGIIYQAVCAGCGGSDLFPTTPGAWSNTNNASNCNLGSIKFDFEIAPVTAQFTLPLSTCTPATLTFGNQSVNAQSYQWFLDDVFISDDEDITLDFFEPGSFAVTLVASFLGTCNDFDTITQIITVPELAEIDFAQTVFCDGSSNIILSSNVEGGTWSGPGVLNSSSGLFSPSSLSPGDYTIDYHYDPGINNCVQDLQVTITITEPPQLTIIAPPTYIAPNSNEFTLTVLVTGSEPTYELSGFFNQTIAAGETITLTGSAIGGTQLQMTLTGTAIQCTAILNVETPVCQPDPGTMPGELQIVCSNGSVSAIASNAVPDEGQFLYYAIHDGSSAQLGTIFAHNQTGTFVFADLLPQAQYNTTYYLSSVVSYPDENGEPLWTDGCTFIAPGTPVVFLEPLELTVDEYCDWNALPSGIFYINAFPEGGYPSYNSSSPYQISGDINIALPVGGNAPTSFEGSMSTQNYALFAVDEYGCVDTAANTFICFKTDVELLNFSGEVRSTGNHLEWTTATETDNDYFSIQRSVNSSDFKEIGRLEGAGTVLTPQSYSFDDLNAPLGLSYYRLTWTDYNGQTEYSQIISLRRGQSSSTMAIQAMPMPASDEVSLLFDATEGDTQITLYDATGKLVFAQVVQVTQSGVYQYQTRLGHLSEGMYWVRAENNGKQLNGKLVLVR